MKSSDFQRLAKYALRENDILVSVVGTLGNACIVRKTDLPAIFSCKSTVIRADDINAYYIVAYLNSKYGRELLLRKERGAIQKGLNLDDLRLLAIPIFSNTFEHGIQDLIINANNILDSAKNTYAAAEQHLLSALGMGNFTPSQEPVAVKSFSESFGASGRLDAEYYQRKYEEFEALLKRHPVSRVEDICSHINYGTVPTSPYTDDGTGIPYIKGMNLCDLEIRNTLDRITNTQDLPEKFYARKNDIIVSQMGTVGDIGVITEAEDGYLFASFTIRIRLKDTKKHIPHFVGLYIQSVAKEWYLLRNIAQASVRQNTDLPTIKNMPIPILDISVQRQIADNVQQSFDLRRQSEQLLDTAKRAVEIAIEDGEDAAIAWLKQPH
jgi:restriction endonuclease S subunit